MPIVAEAPGTTLSDRTAQVEHITVVSRRQCDLTFAAKY